MPARSRSGVDPGTKVADSEKRKSISSRGIPDVSGKNAQNTTAFVKLRTTYTR
jgi:hypothetical protein